MPLFPLFLLTLVSLGVATPFVLMPLSTAHLLPYEGPFLTTLGIAIVVSTFALWFGAKWARRAAAISHGALACYFIAIGIYAYHRSYSIFPSRIVCLLAYAACPLFASFSILRWGRRFSE